MSLLTTCSSDRVNCLSGRVIVFARRQPPLAADPQGNTQQFTHHDLWSGLVCHTCCSAVTARLSVSELLRFIRLHMKASVRRVKHFWAGVWNNMKWLRPKMTAMGGKGRLWRQMVSPTEKDCQERGMPKGMPKCLLLRGRDVGQGRSGMRTKGYVHSPRMTMAASPLCLEGGGLRPPPSSKGPL